MKLHGFKKGDVVVGKQTGSMYIIQKAPLDSMVVTCKVIKTDGIYMDPVRVHTDYIKHITNGERYEESEWV